MTPRCKLPGEIENYLDIVEQKRVSVCREQLQLAAFVRRVFETDDIYVDVNQLSRYLNLQRYFPFKLIAWEKFCFALHNCTYWSETGLPRFPHLLIFVGRGAGKNGYLSFEDFCLMSAVNGIRGYHVDVCATSEDQAKTSFDEIREDVLEKHRQKMIQAWVWTKEEIVNLTTKSKLRFRTSNAKTKDGLRTGKVDFDEYHQYENYDNINKFLGGLGKKPHPRITYATTDGYVRDGPLDDLKTRSMEILKGKETDNGLLPFICRLDDEDEVENTAMWVKANPSLPHFPELKTEMLRAWAECQINPLLYSAFLTQRMNIPVGNKDLAVAEWDLLEAASLPLPDLKGLSCVAGVDYAKTNDFVAVGLLFKKDKIRYWLSHTFVCTQSADMPRLNRDKLDKCARMGLLTYIDDVEINPGVVTEWLAEKALDYNITRIGIDGFRYSLFSSYLERIGFDAKGARKNIKLIRPSNQEYVEPIINSMFINKQIVWGENPLMRWYTNNTKKVVSTHGNFRYEKIEPRSRKTDGFMALVAAMDLEDRLETSPPPLEFIEAFVY